MILRCTSKLQAIVGRPEPASASRAASGDDFYANLIWIEGRKCLLVTHAGTLFSVFAPDVRAADLRPIGAFVVPLLTRQLVTEGFSPVALGPLNSEAVTIAKTADRRVLGCMNDLALHCSYAAENAGGLALLDLGALHHHLERNLSSVTAYIHPIELVAERAELTEETNDEEPASEGS